MKLYKIRWQIEILFKVWKSILQIGQVHKMKPERFLCLLYGQLIWTVLQMKIFQSFKNMIWNELQFEISELKTFRIFRIFADSLFDTLFKYGDLFFQNVLEQLFETIQRLAKKNYKKGNPNPMFIL